MGKGTQTTTSQTSPAPQAMAAYNDLLSRAQSVASTPYQAYTGNLVAGFSPLQEQAFSQIQGMQGAGNPINPYLQTASGLATTGAAPITQEGISRYFNPYQDAVINATMGNLNETFGQQRQALRGNAISQGALGNDQVGQAELARQQGLAAGQTLAGLNQGNYNQALAAAQGDAARAAQGAYTFGNLGQEALGASTMGTQALMGAGSLQQQLEQAKLNVPYQQFQQAQAFPYQQAQWLAGITTGVGSQMGGTGQTTAPGPSPWNQIAGLGMTAASLFLKDGGRVKGYALGGSPYADVTSYIPTIGLTPGRGAPDAPKPYQAQQPDASKMMGQAAGIADRLMNRGVGDPININPMGDFQPSGVGSISDYGSNPALGLLGPLYRDGGAVRRGYQDGGFPTSGLGTGTIIPSFEDRFGGESFAPAVPEGLGFEDRFPYAGTFVASNGLADNRSGLVAHGLASPYAPAVAQAAVPIPRPRPEGLGAIADGDAYPAAFGALNSDDGMPASALGLVAQQRGASVPRREVTPEEIDDPNSAYNRQGLAEADAFLGSPAPAAGPPAPGLSPAGAPPAAVAPAEGQRGFGFANLLNLSPDAKMALMSAGLRMMASQSPSVGAAIGEGGLAGLQTYHGLQQERQAQAMQQGKMDLEVKKLSQAADMARERLDLQRQSIQNTKDYHEQMLKRENKQYLGPTADGEGSVFLNRNTGQTSVEPIKIGSKTASPGAVLDDDTAAAMAGQYLAGDKSVLTNLGRGAQGAENVIKVRREILNQARAAGMNPSDIASTLAEYSGELAGQRAVGTRAANISMAANEANNMIPIALEASAAVPRTNWVPINKAVQMVQTGTSSPELARFVAANNSLVNAYVRAISPTGVPTESVRQHAWDMLNTVQGPEAYKAVTDIMQTEMKAALHAPEQVRKELRDAARNKNAPIQGTPVAPAGVPAGLPAVGEKPKVSTKAAYDALPAGTEFIGSDGKPYRKP